MSFAERGGKSLSGFLNNVMDRMLGSEPVAPVVDKRAQNLAKKQMNIRAVGVREGFAAMRARSDEMASRLEQFKKQRQHAENTAAPAQAPEQVETIVLSSASTRRASGAAH